MTDTLHTTSEHDALWVILTQRIKCLSHGAVSNITSGVGATWDLVLKNFPGPTRFKSPPMKQRRAFGVI